MGSGDGYVEAGVWGTNRNLLGANVALLACVFGVVLLMSQYLYNYAFGPFPMGREALLGLKDPHALWDIWVTVQADRVTDTGVDAVQVDNTKSGTTKMTTGRYVLADLGSRVLLVKVPAGFTGTALMGELQRVADDRESYEVNSFLAAMPNQGALLPFMMDATDFRAKVAPWVALIILLTGVALWNLWKVWRRSARPEAHPLYRALGAYGPVAAMVTSVDEEVAGPKAIRFGGWDKAILTPHWLLSQSTFGVKAVHLDDLVWVYEQVTHGKGTSYSVVLWTDKGTHTVIHDRENVVVSILNHVREYAPWAQVGKTPELEKAWRKDRRRMISGVADRQRAIKAQ